MSFECFTAALSLVAEAKYGATDSIARLVYFKIIRFGRSAKSAAIHHASASGASGEASGAAAARTCYRIRKRMHLLSHT
jgi:hypothetical protein